MQTTNESLLVAVIQLPAIDPPSCTYVLIKAQSIQEELESLSAIIPQIKE